MDLIYNDTVNGMVKAGIHCADWIAAQSAAFGLTSEFPPKDYGTNVRFKRVSDGVELHVQRFAKA